MPIPKVGDILRSKTGNEWRITALTRANRQLCGYVWRGYGTVITGVALGYRSGDTGSIILEEETVEESGWGYVETPFQRYVREVLDGAETGG